MTIEQLIQRKALFVVNNSGGKDSQAMLHKIRKMVPADQILVVYAKLPGVVWDGTEEHARDISKGLNFIVVEAVKTFFEMVDRRQNWPSSQYRQCTSDLKRGPIEKAIRGWIKEYNLSGLVVNCMGLRAQESAKRKCGLDKTGYAETGEVTTFKFNKRNSKAGREWYDWLPIHDYSISDVWLEIKKAGQKPHWAYASGMSRLSCCFCIMSSKADLVIRLLVKALRYAILRLEQIQYQISSKEIVAELKQVLALVESKGGNHD